MEAYELGYNCTDGSAPEGYTRLALRLLEHPGWLWTLLREHPLTRPLTAVPQSIYDAVAKRPEGPMRRRRLLESGTINLTELGTARFLQLTRKLPKATCDPTFAPMSTLIHSITVACKCSATATSRWSLVARNPLTAVLRMGALTGQYYRQRLYDVPPPMCPNGSNWLTCAAFRLPPPTNTSRPRPLPPWAQVVDTLLLLPTMGGGGLATLDALLSDMPYDQARSANLNPTYARGLAA